MGSKLGFKRSEKGSCVDGIHELGAWKGSVHISSILFVFMERGARYKWLRFMRRNANRLFIIPNTATSSMQLSTQYLLLFYEGGDITSKCWTLIAAGSIKLASHLPKHIFLSSWISSVFDRLCYL
jgi:hypothetical protein